MKKKQKKKGICKKGNNYRKKRNKYRKNFNKNYI